MKLPFKKGETWVETSKNECGDTVTIRLTSVGEEEVEVPAGKFRCLRVDAECTLRGWACTMTTWMAPRWGVIKSVTVCKDTSGKLGDYVLTGVLKSFSAGGK